MILNKTTKSKQETLVETIKKIIDSGFVPGNNKQGYILKKLLRLCHKENIVIEHQFYHDEIQRQERILVKWERLKDKHQDKPKEWWWDTHGIDLDLI
jgi:alanyl-tRNA synthetase